MQGIFKDIGIQNATLTFKSHLITTGWKGVHSGKHELS